MARIVKTDIQETALKVVKGNIRVLEGIDRVLGMGEEKARITVTAGREKVSLEVRKPSGDNILRDIRRKMAAETLMLARKNAIELDGKEWSVLKGQTGDTSDRVASERPGPIPGEGPAGDGAEADEGGVEVIAGTDPLWMNGRMDDRE